MRAADENIKPGSLPKNWFEAFDILRNYLQALKESKKVVFWEMEEQGLKTCLPYLEIYGHWTPDETKLETGMLWCLK